MLPLLLLLLLLAAEHRAGSRGFSSHVAPAVPHRLHEALGHCADNAQHAGVRGGVHAHLHHEDGRDGVSGGQSAPSVCPRHWLPPGDEFGHSAGSGPRQAGGHELPLLLLLLLF
jgi:hypothetical protein